MKVPQNKKLIQLIKFIPSIIVIAFAVWVNIIVVNDNRAKLSEDIATLQHDFVDSQKRLIKEQVKHVVAQVEYEKNTTVNLLKQDIRERIHQAYDIAITIYENNQDKPEAQVTKLISDALRNIRFNQGRGYYFIYKTDGLSVMHPALPSMEGTSKWDFQDVRGSYIVRDMGKIVKEQGEAFYHWWFIKPQNKAQQFEKIGYGKYFAPYDWFIGTGEYIADVENDIKQRLLKRISKISYGEAQYVFVVDYEGNRLSNIAGENATVNQQQFKDEKDDAVLQSIVGKAQQPNGDYLRYMSSFNDTSDETPEKISFVMGIPGWEWAIGTGTYISEIEKYLSDRELVISQKNSQQLMKILMLSLFLTLFFVTLSIVLGRYLTKLFGRYEAKINDDFAQLNNIKEKLQYQALHDDLTKLPNRVSLAQKIEQGIEASKKTNTSLAVMFVDLDDFKKINDRHGHTVGDGLLARLGELFNQFLDGKDSIARFGGDEFIFCFPQLNSVAQAEENAKSIQQVLNQEFIVDGKVIYSSCSIGIAMYPNDGQSPEELVTRADIVLYKSKAQQKGQFLFYNEQINQRVQREIVLESELRLAIARNELSVVYQPQIGVDNGKIYGVEALVRWHSSLLGHVPPDEFINVAEDAGLINDIGAFVIEQSLLDITRYNKNRQSPLQLSINISPKQLAQPHFCEELLSKVNSVGFNTNWVTLELTENALISDLKTVEPLLQSLRDCGFCLSLDDFGTGYSSLSYLSNLPMTEIKIDRSFIDKFLTNKQSESLVKTIIAIGQFCNLIVVAEGVETKEQYERLAQYRCNIIQGYYFDRPLGINELTDKYS